MTATGASRKRLSPEPESDAKDTVSKKDESPTPPNSPADTEGAKSFEQQVARVLSEKPVETALGLWEKYIRDRISEFNLDPVTRQYAPNKADPLNPESAVVPWLKNQESALVSWLKKLRNEDRKSYDSIFEPILLKMSYEHIEQVINATQDQILKLDNERESNKGFIREKRFKSDLEKPMIELVEKQYDNDVKTLMDRMKWFRELKSQVATLR